MVLSEKSESTDTLNFALVVAVVVVLDVIVVVVVVFVVFVVVIVVVVFVAATADQHWLTNSFKDFVKFKVELELKLIKLNFYDYKKILLQFI